MAQSSSCRPVIATNCDLSDSEWLENLSSIITHAGSPADEDNDCSIIALSVVADLEYELSRDIIEAAIGRKPRDCTPSLYHMGKHLPFKLKNHVRYEKDFHRRKTVWTFKKNHPYGRYFLEVGGWTNGHSLALIHGTIVDCNYTSPCCKVRGAWSIEGLKKGI